MTPDADCCHQTYSCKRSSLLVFICDLMLCLNYFYVSYSCDQLSNTCMCRASFLVIFYSMVHFRVYWSASCTIILINYTIPVHIIYLIAISWLILDRLVPCFGVNRSIVHCCCFSDACKQRVLHVSGQVDSEMLIEGGSQI